VSLPIILVIVTLIEPLQFNPVLFVVIVPIYMLLGAVVGAMYGIVESIALYVLRQKSV